MTLELAIVFATLGLLLAALIIARPEPKRPLMLAMMIPDLPQADHIEITIAEHPDGVRLWVNVDGVNTFRAYKVKNLTIDDRRDWSTASAVKTAE